LPVDRGQAAGPHRAICWSATDGECWKPADDRGFELAVPAERFTVEDLLALAATVAPSR
jgi:hypothetical protein